MPGLTFDDTPAPDPDTPLVMWLDEWVESTAHHARRTVAGYVADVAGFAETLLTVVGKPTPPTPTPDELVASDVVQLCATFGCRPHAYLRARAAFTALVLLDLHPNQLARAVNRFKAGRVRRSRRPANAQGRGDATLRRAVAAWSSYCRFLVARQVLAANPVDAPAVVLPRPPAYRPAPLSYAEAERLFTVAAEPDPRARRPWPARDLALVAMFLATGVRCEEAITARARDLFDESDVGTRVQVLGKGHKRRTIPVYVEAAEAVHAYLQERVRRLGAFGPDDPLFVRANGRPFDASALYRVVDRLFDRAVVARTPGATVHALRHTFATHAIDTGTTIVELQALMGHGSIETTRRYLAVVGDGLERAVESHASRQMLRQVQQRSRAATSAAADPTGVRA
jgi:site-specific recombinase XerD